MNKISSVKTLLSSTDLVSNNKSQVQGWVRSIRTSKNGFSFIAINDGSCQQSIQIVADQELPNYSAITKLSTGSALHIEGVLIPSEGHRQAVEINASVVTIVGSVLNPQSYPIAKKRHSFEYLRSVAHLRPRTNTFGAVARLRNTISQTIHSYLNSAGFIWVHTPIITTSDCEGAGELFKVSTLDLLNLPKTASGDIDFGADFFGQQAFLTVSGQLQVESYCLAMSKVYTFGPTFRAEDSNTNRHLAEFWMIEPEIAFADLAINADLAENMLQYLAKTVLDKCSADLEFFTQHVDDKTMERLQNLANAKFERMEYSEAITILEQSGEKFEFPVYWGVNLQSEHERYLVEKHVNKPVTLINYPKEIKAFYMRQNSDDKTVAAMDVLVPGIGEIIGGSQREERFDVLEARLKEMEIDSELDWYQDLRRYGTAPHSGFGLGLERLVQYFSGLKNIRDAIPFPRVPNNAGF